MRLFENHYALDYANTVADLSYVLWIVAFPKSFIELSYTFDATEGAVLLANLVGIMALGARVSLWSCRRQGANPDVTEAIGWAFYGIHVYWFRDLVQNWAMFVVTFGLAVGFTTSYAARAHKARQVRKTTKKIV